MPIFKYFSEETYALAFIAKGEMLLRPLSYFRAYEDDGVRGDRLDGVLTYAPPAGLEINKQDGSILKLEGWRFTSSAQQSEIYVYCASNSLSSGLAEKFGSFCVEIPDPALLIRRLNARACRTSQLDYEQVLSGEVEYRKNDVEPGADWALPERLAFVKPEDFSRQDEFRIAVGKRGALAVENVACKLESDAAPSNPTEADQGKLLLRIGKLQNLVHLHRL